MHELLHLLGLPDTYQERQRGFYVDSKTGEVSKKHEDHKWVMAYDCRVTTEPNNIMSHHYKRWESVFLKESKKSLLEPDQFNAIIFGSCPINEKFSRCAKLMHESSILNPKCLQQKSKCLQ